MNYVQDIGNRNLCMNILCPITVGSLSIDYNCSVLSFDPKLQITASTVHRLSKPSPT